PSPSTREVHEEPRARAWAALPRPPIRPRTTGEPPRLVYEKKAELALDNGFASKIEPAETDKDAFIIAHPGAAEYINDDTKSFMDKYSDMMYLGAGALSVIGSIFAGIYTKITRVAPERAGELATELLCIGEKIEHAHSLDELDELQDQLEAILRGVIIGMRDGTISGDGLETFKLGYEFVRDDIAMRRDHLKRHSGDKVADDNLALVKTARSAWGPFSCPPTQNATARLAGAIQYPRGGGWGHEGITSTSLRAASAVRSILA